MTLNRRSFIGLGSLAACGRFLSVPTFAAGVPDARGLCDIGEAVLAYVRSYSADFRVVDAPEPGSVRPDGLRKLHLLAEVADLDHWPAAMARAPFQGMRASGNTLAFAHQGLDITIENLTPAIFGERLAALG